MHIQYFIFTGAIALLASEISSSIIKRNVIDLPITAPIYISQQPVNTGSIHPYYFYYPQSQYPNTGVVYQTAGTTVQYPYYGWPNTSGYVPSVPATPSNGFGANSGDPNNPKNDVEYII